MNHIHIGHAGLKGDFERYARKFSFVELAGDAGRLPKRARLRAWAAAAPAEFQFALTLPSVVAGLEPGARRDEELRRALGDAEALAARWVVIRTPASVRPSSSNVKRLGELVHELGESRRIAWEPSGLWDTDEAAKVAAELSVCLVRDPLRQDIAAEQVSYLRVRALGVTSRMSAESAEHVAEVVQALTEIGGEAWVAVEGGGAGRVLRALGDVEGGWDELDSDSRDGDWEGGDLDAEDDDGEADDDDEGEPARRALDPGHG